jgi:hypothetical protein
MFCIDRFTYVGICEVECRFKLVPMVFLIVVSAICNVRIHFSLVVIGPILNIPSFYIVKAKGNAFVGFLEDRLVVVQFPPSDEGPHEVF